MNEPTNDELADYLQDRTDWVRPGFGANLRLAARRLRESVPRDVAGALRREAALALIDYEALNKAAKVCKIHPFTITPANLATAIDAYDAATKAEATP